MCVIRNHFVIWRITGLWGLPNDTLSKRMFAKFMFLVTNGLFLTLMFVDLAMTRNFSELIAAILGITTKWLITFKAVLLMRNRPLLMRIFELTAAIESNCIPDVPAEHQHLKRANRVAQRLLIGVFIGCSSTVVIGFLSVALPKARLMMWRMWFPFDWASASSVLPYRAALGYQILSNLHHAILFATADTYGLAFYSTLSAALDILADRVRRLATDVTETAAQRQRALIDCVRYHHLCLEYLHVVIELYQVHYAMLFAISSTLLCVIAYTLSTMGSSSSTAQWSFMILYLLNMSVQLFIPCYFGTILQMKSDALSKAAFDCGWPEDGAGKSAFRKYVLLFMMGSHQPMTLRTWKSTFVIELSTFVMVYRAAYSLLSCLSGF